MNHWTPEQVAEIVEYILTNKEMYDLSDAVQQYAYDKVQGEMPYGALTGDDDTPDNWFADYFDGMSLEEQAEWWDLPLSAR